MEPERITPDEAQRMWASGAPVAFVDARSAESWAKASRQIPGSVRVPPDDVESRLAQVPQGKTIITYCT